MIPISPPAFELVRGIRTIPSVPHTLQCRVQHFVVHNIRGPDDRRNRGDARLPVQRHLTRPQRSQLAVWVVLAKVAAGGHHASDRWAQLDLTPRRVSRASTASPSGRRSNATCCRREVQRLGFWPRQRQRNNLPGIHGIRPRLTLSDRAATLAGVGGRTRHMLFVISGPTRERPRLPHVIRAPPFQLAERTGLAF